jgi:hypothetical protein
VHHGGNDEQPGSRPVEWCVRRRSGHPEITGRRDVRAARTATTADAGGFLQRPSRERPAPAVSFLTADGDPARYRRSDEPIGPDEVIDYRYLFSLVLDRCAREDDRGKSLDAKITALIAGVVGFIAFSGRMQPSVWNAVETLAYLVPLGLLLRAFMVERGAIAPTAESLRTFFPEFPVTTLRDAVAAMTRACAANARINDTKAGRLDVAVVFTAVTTAIVLVTQFVAALR